MFLVNAWCRRIASPYMLDRTLPRSLGALRAG